jgi:IS30 family transposase
MHRRRQWTDGERAELWQRWKAGQTISEIGRSLGRSPATVHHAAKYDGGYVPATRRRAPRSLALAEREAISRGLSCGASLRQIAAQLGRAPSTIAREVRRNQGRDEYRAVCADERAWREAHRWRPGKLDHWPLQQTVAAKLGVEWSPEQIAGWLKRHYPGNPRMHVSHETIYRSLFLQAKGVLKGELVYQLRGGRIMRRAKTAGKPAAGGIVVSIRARPAEADDRAVPGHWEGDLLAGSENSYIATLVERRSRFTMLVKVNSKHSAGVTSALAKQICKLPVELRRSLTWDRGSEMARHKEFTVATDVQVYFCDPHSPWQRGTNENTNGLLRQYFPKGTSLADYTQTELNHVARRLNGRPRKTLGWQSPAEFFSTSVATTG